MPIPSVEQILLPLLQSVKNGKEHESTKITEQLSDHFSLTEDEQQLMMPSGHARVIANRISWAKNHLINAGFLIATQRGFFRITEEGLSFINKNRESLTISYLRKTPQYSALRKIWRKKRKQNEEEDQEVPEELGLSQTPEELLESSYQNIRQALAQEILAKVKASSPKFFERLVMDLLVKMGYGGTLHDARAIGKSGDGGIDGIIKEDKLGLDVIYVQAKRWENVVGRPEIQKFIGALAGKGAKKGIFITTADFTDEAKGFQPLNDTKIVLIDGEELAEYMMDYDVGVAKDRSYDIKKIDHDYFEEE